MSTLILRTKTGWSNSGPSAKRIHVAEIYIKENGSVVASGASFVTKIAAQRKACSAAGLPLASFVEKVTS